MSEASAWQLTASSTELELGLVQSVQDLNSIIVLIFESGAVLWEPE